MKKHLIPTVADSPKSLTKGHGHRHNVALLPGHGHLNGHHRDGKLNMTADEGHIAVMNPPSAQIIPQHARAA